MTRRGSLPGESRHPQATPHPQSSLPITPDVLHVSLAPAHLSLFSQPSRAALGLVSPSPSPSPCFLAIPLCSAGRCLLGGACLAAGEEGKVCEHLVYAGDGKEALGFKPHGHPIKYDRFSDGETEAQRRAKGREEECQTCMPDRGPPVVQSSVRCWVGRPGARSRLSLVPCGRRQADGHLPFRGPSTNSWHVKNQQLCLALVEHSAGP